MAAEIFSKAGGQVVQAELNAIQLESPSIVRLQMLRSDIASMERVGNNLVLKLTNGETITLSNFYATDAAASVHDLVIQEAGGEMWLARPDLGPNYFELANWEELNEPVIVAAAGMGLGGILAGGAALGGLGIAAGAGGGDGDGGGGGDDDDDGNGGGTPPDTAAPDAPTLLTFNPAGSVLSGVGEPGATITVRGPNDEILSNNVVVGANGQFNVPLTPPLINKEQVSVIQTDVAGNPSGAASTAAPDLTKPDAPTALDFNLAGNVLTGTGERGATITVRGPDNEILSDDVVVGADGKFTVELDTALINKQQVSVIQTDAAGNASLPASTAAPDLTNPDAPTLLTFNPAGSVLSGVGEAGTTVTVRGPNNEILSNNVVVGANGQFNVPLNPPLIDGEQIRVSLTDAAGNPSLPTAAFAPDTADIDQFTLSVDDDSVNAILTYESDPLEPVADVVIPAALDIAGLSIGGLIGALLGQDPPSLELSVADGEIAALTFTFSAGLAVDLSLSNPVIVVQRKDGENWVNVTPDGAPLQLTVVGISNVGTLKLLLPEGEYRAIPASNVVGVTISGALSVQGTVYDTNSTVPPVTSVTDNFFDNDTVPQGTIIQSVRFGGTPTQIPSVGGATIQGQYGSLRVEQDGTYTYTPNEPAALGSVTDIFTYTPYFDGAISESSTLTITINRGNNLPNDFTVIGGGVVDTTPPLAPSQLVVQPGGAGLTGLGESNTFVEVFLKGTNVSVGTGSVDSNGVLTATLSPVQNNYQLLDVKLTDGAGNVSPPAEVRAPDEIDPEQADDLAVVDGGATLTGTGETGAKVTVYDPDGNLIGEGVANGTVPFSISLYPPQRDGEILEVFLEDASGRLSDPAEVTADDIAGPAAPENLEIDDDGLILTGEGEADAQFFVYLADGANVGILLGQGTVLPTGEFEFSFEDPLVDGEEVVVILRVGTDESAPRNAIAPDLLIASNNNETSTISVEAKESANIFLGDSTGSIANLGLLGLAVLEDGDRYVEFRVDAGQRMVADFEYTNFVELTALGGFSLIVEKNIDGVWVDVAVGTDASTLLSLSLLDGDIVADGEFGPGAYRASVGFSGSLLNLGLLGRLEVTGKLYDYRVPPVLSADAVTGNVIEDHNGDDTPDKVPVEVLPDDTAVVTAVVTEVSVVGIADSQVDVTEAGILINGLYGELFILANGSYTYTPNLDPANNGSIDKFSYTISAPNSGPPETATLAITVNVPALGEESILLEDNKTVSVEFANVVTTSTEPEQKSTFGFGLFAANRTNFDFTVDQGTESGVKILVDLNAALSALPTLALTIKNASGVEVFPKVTVTAFADVVGLLGSGYEFTLPADLGAGTYTVTIAVSGLNLAGTANVSILETVTDLGAFEVVDAESIDGNVLANDDIDTEFFKLLVDSDGVGGVNDAIGAEPVLLIGRYGTLSIDADGNYSYIADSEMDRLEAAVTDTFRYGVQQINGDIEFTDLKIHIDPLQV